MTQVRRTSTSRVATSDMVEVTGVGRGMSVTERLRRLMIRVADHGAVYLVQGADGKWLKFPVARLGVLAVLGELRRASPDLPSYRYLAYWVHQTSRGSRGPFDQTPLGLHRDSWKMLRRVLAGEDVGRPPRRASVGAFFRNRALQEARTAGRMAERQLDANPNLK